MTLDADQFFEISLAIRGGCAAGSWNSMTDAERAHSVAIHRTLFESRIADPNISEQERGLLEEGLAQLGHPELRYAAAREQYYAQPTLERRRRLAGWKQDVNEILSQSSHFSNEQRTAIDARLAERSLPTLRQLEIGLRKRHTRILQRGRIRDLDEFYLVKEIVCDMALEITDAERARFEGLLGEFEARAKNLG